jgi:hypothetical protein
MRLINDESSYPSGPAVTNLDLPIFHDDRHFPNAIGKFEHFIELATVLKNLYIGGLVSVSRPGPLGVGSTRLAVNNDLVSHVMASLSRG